MFSNFSDRVIGGFDGNSQAHPDTRRFAGCLFFIGQGRRDTKARQGFRAVGLHRSSQSLLVSNQPKPGLW